MTASFRIPFLRQLFFVVLVCGFAWAGYRYWHTSPAYKGVSRIQIDMRQPELLLVTRNLADLPKDFASASQLQGLVDEAMVFHYEDDEASLSLEGTLRRLAYEHNLELPDRFLATLLSAPAEIAIWRSSKGRPEHFAAAMERGMLARFTEMLAKLVLNDGQLKQAGVFSMGSAQLPLYTLAYGGGRTLGFVGAGDRWVFLSDPGLVLDEQNGLTADAQQVLGELLDGGHPWQEALPPSTEAKHSVIVGSRALTLDYSRFVPALQALRLDYTGGSWQAALRAAGQALPDARDLSTALTQIWGHVPLNAALCFAVPVDWDAAASPLKALVDGRADPQPMLAALDPIGAVCWYAGSRLSAPLFIARATRPLPPDTSTVLAALADRVWTEAGDAQAQTDDSGNGDERYGATVYSRHGLPGEGDDGRRFRPLIARHGQLLLFSPDQRNVDAALAVASKQAPAAGDLPGLQGPAWMTVDPKHLGQLIRAEMQQVLPADEESFFREIARTRLWPRLDAWGRRQAPTALVPGRASEHGFFPLTATTMGAPAAAAR